MAELNGQRIALLAADNLTSSRKPDDLPAFRETLVARFAAHARKATPVVGS